MKSKRAAATALLSGESQVDLLFYLWEVYENSRVKNGAIVFGICLWIHIKRKITFSCFEGDLRVVEEGFYVLPLSIPTLAIHF